MRDRNAMKLQMNRRMALAALLGGALLATSCVTINIYFPAAAAEKAADRIIDEVWQLKGGTPAPAPSAKPATK
jgi:hypothetical protein